MTLFEEMMESTWFAITTLVASLVGLAVLWYFSILGPRPLFMELGVVGICLPFLIGIEVVGVALLALLALVLTALSEIRWRMKERER